MLLETLFWLALVLGALAAPIGWPFRFTSVGFGALGRRHGLDPAAAHRVRRATLLGQAAVGDRERAATAEWAGELLDQRARTVREHPGRWRAFLALQAAEVTVALAGFVVTIARRGGSAPVLLVLFGLVAAGPLVGPLVRRRGNTRVHRAVEVNQPEPPTGPQPEPLP